MISARINLIRFYFITQNSFKKHENKTVIYKKFFWKSHNAAFISQKSQWEFSEVST